MLKLCCALVMALWVVGVSSLPAVAGDAEVAEILKLHEGALAAHRANDIDALLGPESDVEYVLGSRGEVFFPTREERAAQLGPYLAQTKFTRYEDLIPPVVRVSDDATLAWLVCQVRVEGTRTMPSGETHPVDSTWAWIELYEKRDGKWVRAGNLSSMKPVQ